MKRITFKLNGTIQVFRFGKTSNAKISKGNENIVQTYTYSEDQFNYVKDTLAAGEKLELKKFYSLDGKNCFDCPFSINSGNGGCYTHKFGQYRGFIGMLKSLINEFGSVAGIPDYSDEIAADVIIMSVDKYVRFGSYGEPSMHPIEMVERMTKASKSWTGYTHQYFKKPEYAAFFMASVHNPKQMETAADKYGYRSFIVVENATDINAVQCPASKEGGLKSNCADCGLCSGVTGKGKKSVVILEH